ncbi:MULTISPECIES: hypothetical protein [Actinomycetes]|uniref:hypothetical protein n=1 Tax=Actinomycetes TaxID=1760 RepID=UPI000CFBDAF0|nr:MULTISPECIES: hypothetical protein [unclassified Arthrobacter]PQZ83737.1 hypothetical protein CQ016_16680 [Arthrobacter sp. MYb222]PRB76079.1 hypothetical protein CQ012_10515 [Arthrobacter sp. MYb214]
MSGIAMAPPAAPPSWAVQRVATVIERQGIPVPIRDAKRIAQKAGVSKSLARRCIHYMDSGK